MWKWVTELLDRREAERERQRQHELNLRVCHSCNVLSMELARSKDRESQLIAALTKLPEQVPQEPPFQAQVQVNNKKSWAVKKQELEQKYKKPIANSVTVENLDEEIKNAAR